MDNLNLNMIINKKKVKKQIIKEILELIEEYKIDIDVTNLNSNTIIENFY